MPELVHELDMHAEVTPDDVGLGPLGHRRIATITSGSVRGPRLNGTMTGAGADWILRGPDGYGRVDARLTITTDDGAKIYLQYVGLLELTPAIVAVMSGGGDGTAYGDQYFVTGPRFETGDSRYDWLNRSVFVAEGRLVPGPAVDYQVFRVAGSRPPGR
ncbi:MAG TPA: DUF3237 domain-containing protein [Actinomycetospora sp.]|jgi:hypothetical protein|uniref:DUF3237 domain-containing protein n=1 Tax=Actinomycetospora sp. TaxID=1872135 RepID=UPI002F3E97C4